MQDRYAGDVGDFVKLGLIRHLSAAPDAGGAGMTVGLNWYLAPDESHNGDSKHVAYLDPGNRHHRSLASCDPELIAHLINVVATGRSVAALERSGALPATTLTHSERLSAIPSGPHRGEWHRRALAALAGADVVFTDPDNGLGSPARTTKLHKYSLLTELADYAHRGHSLVAYQHAGRSAPAESQARDRLQELAHAVDQAPVGALIARRGSCRFFLVTATEVHQQRLTRAMGWFASRWAPHVELLPATR